MRSVLIVLAVLFYSVCVSAEPDNAHYAVDMGTEPDYSAPYAEYSADDPLGEFDIERAAQFVDGVAVKWGVKHDCVASHTTGNYLMVPPKPVYYTHLTLPTIYSV